MRLQKVRISFFVVNRVDFQSFCKTEMELNENLGKIHNFRRFQKTFEGFRKLSKVSENFRRFQKTMHLLHMRLVIANEGCLPSHIQRTLKE